MSVSWFVNYVRAFGVAVSELVLFALFGLWEYRKVLTIVSGPAAAFLISIIGKDKNEEDVKVQRMGGILLWMAIWWLTEAVPAPITSLLPLSLFPLTGILYADEVAKAYWNDIVVLYFGSLVVALAIERWKVHRRLALGLLLSFGSRVTNPRLLLLGFIGCTGILSMFMSNTATSIMMVPMAVAVLHKVRRNANGIAMYEIALANRSSSNRSNSLPEEGETKASHVEGEPDSPLHAAMIPLRPEDNLQVNDSGPDNKDSRKQEYQQHSFVALPFGGDENWPEQSKNDEEAHEGSSTGMSDGEFLENDHEDENVGIEGELENGDRLMTGRKSDKVVKSRLADLNDPVTQYCRAIVLGIAYSASIGGMGSLTSAGPNLILAGTFSRMFPEAPRISYLDWLAFGLPLSLVFLFILWTILCIIFCPPVSVPVIRAALDRSVLEQEYARLGPMKFAEKAVLCDFVVLSLLWLTRNPGGGVLGWGMLFENDKAVGDGTASAFCAIVLFVIPSMSGKPWQMLMDWETCRTMPWDVVLLLGGGFALSAGVTSSGLAAWIGDHVSSLHRVPALCIPPLLAFVVTFGTEFTSNSASATIILPLLASLSLSMGRHPLLLMLPATIACSFAFMLPIATAQNAVAYSTGFLKLRHLLLPGIFLNLIGVLLIGLTIPTLGQSIFGLLNDPSKFQWYEDAKEGLLPSNSTSAP